MHSVARLHLAVTTKLGRMWNSTLDPDMKIKFWDLCILTECQNGRDAKAIVNGDRRNERHVL